MSKCIVCLSGGLDSATLLGFCLNAGMDVCTVAFVYGSKHNPYENCAAAELARRYKIPFWLFDLRPAFSGFKSNLLSAGGAIPEGHYNAETMKQTVVPGRNLIFLAIAAGLAQSNGCDKVAIAVHRGDHVIYPDCRPDFMSQASIAISMSSEGQVELYTPFLYYSKKEILRTALDLGVPLDMTRTCYKAQPVACGKCGSCQERLEAFNELGLFDPLEYEWRGLLPKDQAVEHE